MTDKNKPNLVDINSEEFKQAVFDFLLNNTTVSSWAMVGTSNVETRIEIQNPKTHRFEVIAES